MAVHKVQLHVSVPSTGTVASHDRLGAEVPDLLCSSRRPLSDNCVECHFKVSVHLYGDLRKQFMCDNGTVVSKVILLSAPVAVTVHRSRI